MRCTGIVEVLVWTMVGDFYKALVWTMVVGCYEVLVWTVGGLSFWTVVGDCYEVLVQGLVVVKVFLLSMGICSQLAGSVVVSTTSRV